MLRNIADRSFLPSAREGAEVYGDIVDQSRRAHARGHQEEGSGGLAVGVRPRLLVDERDVVDRDTGLCREHISGCIEHRARAPSARGDTRLQRLVQRQSSYPVTVREVHVAARQRKTVGLADGGPADHLDREVEVAHHPADQRELLGVLLAEERDVGPGQVQQLADAGHHAVEGPRAVFALEPVAQRSRGDPHLGLTIRVDDVRGRGEDHVDLLARAECKVGVEGARIAVEVLPRRELQGVEEDRDDHGVAACARGPDQLTVPFVQRTHGHDDRYLTLQGITQAGQLDAVARPGGSHGHRRPPPAARTSSSDSALSAASSPAANARSAVNRDMATYAARTCGAVKDERCARTVPASPRATGPVRAASPWRSALSSAAPSSGPSIRRGSSMPAATSRSAATLTTVTRLFAPNASAAWYIGRASSGTQTGSAPISMT